MGTDVELEIQLGGQGKGQVEALLGLESGLLGRAAEARAREVGRKGPENQVMLGHFP